MTAGLPPKALERAQMLAATVHGAGDAHDVAAILTPLGTGDLYALCVSLAAMVDVEKTPATLLAWATHIPPQKRCTRCAEWLPVARFPADRSRPDGRNSRCRSCQSEHSRGIYARRKAQRRGLRAVS